MTPPDPGLQSNVIVGPWSGSQRAAAANEILALELAMAERGAEQLGTFLQAHLPSDFFAPPGDFHRGIYRDLAMLMARVPIEGRVRDAAAYAYPRGHGKTTTITKGFACWVACEWQRMAHFQGAAPFIVIVSQTQESARDRALDLRDQFEANESLRAKYGDLAGLDELRRSRAGSQRDKLKARRAQRKWTESDFTLTNGVRVVAVGAGSKRVRGLLRSGRRPTLILVDDLENDENVRTREQRGKLERWLQKALIPTGLPGRLVTIAVGTILHADSLLSSLLSTDPKLGKYTHWLKRRFAALYNDQGMPDVDGDRPLWPEFMTRALLMARRDDIGSTAFAQEYLNQPVDDERALFRREWLDRAVARGAGRGFLYAPPPRVTWDVQISTWDVSELAEKANDATAYQVLVTAWDLGLVEDERRAREQDSDYTVGCTVGLTLDDRLEVRRIFRKRGMTPAQVRERVIREQRVVGADVVVIENNAAQRIYEMELREVKDLPIRGHTTDRRKSSVYEGVPGLAMLVELDRIDFAWRTVEERARIEVLVQELNGLGVEAHDDTVMALWMAVYQVRRWQRIRDEHRRKLLGPPPAGYRATFRWREDERADRRAA